MDSSASPEDNLVSARVPSHFKRSLVIAFSLQQRLHGHASMIRYTYISCLVVLLRYTYISCLVVLLRYTYISCLVVLLRYMYISCLVILLRYTYISCLVILLRYMYISCLVILLRYTYISCLVILSFHPVLFSAFLPYWMYYAQCDMLYLLRNILNVTVNTRLSHTCLNFTQSSVKVLTY
jgi:hypothetical protein